jgi:hypothetical protein
MISILHFQIHSDPVSELDKAIVRLERIDVEKEKDKLRNKKKTSKVISKMKSLNL